MDVCHLIRLNTSLCADRPVVWCIMYTGMTFRSPARQVEFESSKHEARRLLEEVDVLNGQVEEQTALKRIAEKQMEEALEALQVTNTALFSVHSAVGTGVKYGFGTRGRVPQIGMKEKRDG